MQISGEETKSLFDVHSSHHIHFSLSVCCILSSPAQSIAPSIFSERANVAEKVAKYAPWR